MASDDNADCVPEDDQYKYSDDLSILELVMLADILTEYNFLDHVASDIGVDQLYLPAQGLQTQIHLDKNALWTQDNLMKLKKYKTNYILFTRSRTDFTTRLTINNKFIDRQNCVKLLGVWLQQDGGWGKHVKETCKKAYMRMFFFSKLRYAAIERKELVHNYKQLVRTALEYCSVAYHSSLTEIQSNKLERCQAVALRIILQKDYESYQLALLLTGLEKLSARRKARCLDFSLKCTEDAQNNRFFPKNQN